MHKGGVTTCIGSSNNRVCMGKFTMMTGIGTEYMYIGMEYVRDIM